MNKQLKSNPKAHLDEFTRSSTCRTWLELHTPYVNVYKHGVGGMIFREGNRAQNPTKMYCGWGTSLERTEFLLNGYEDHHFNMSVCVFL